MTKVETRKFDADVGKVLSLMINSLYTNKDIFLRELISNASDACDKLRFEALQAPDLLGEEILKIVVTVDPDKKELMVADTGIGMNKQELIENLGTVARSGTQKFVEKLTGAKTQDVNLIGQFGVGFYSAFMVADAVTVKTRKAGDTDSWVWHSKGSEEFTVKKSDEELPRGTQIILHLKENEALYADKFRIKHIISTYSDHISIPIELAEKDKSETVGSTTALWLKPKADVTEQEYLEFYKKTSHSGDAPWMTLHNKNEGTVNYSNLLFIPSNRGFDLFHPDRKTKVKLYINRVFINDDGIDIVPKYFRFLKGIIDSSDLPLNISRETLQHNAVLEKIKKSLTKRVISELEKKLRDDRASYLNFWQNFGPVVKEGLCEQLQANEDLLGISLFKHLNGSGYITLAEYVKNMKPGQEAIYYISGDTEQQARAHPQLEGFKKKGIDVLLFSDAVDDFWVNVISQYKEKDLTSVTRSDIDLAKIHTDSPEVEKVSEEELTDSDLDGVLKYCKLILKDVVKDVRASKKLTSSPACLAVDAGVMDLRLEKFLKEQKQLTQDMARVLEINPKHQIIEFIGNAVKTNSTDEGVERLVHMLFDQACVIEGVPVNDTAGFINRLNDCIIKSLG
jgi:molecular chaperone HtpG